MNIERIEFTEHEVDALKVALNAWLDTYRGRSATDASDIDTLQLSKGVNCNDLADVQLYQEFTEDFEMASADLKFEHEGFGEVHVRVSRVNGSIWVVGNAPENVLDRVFAAVKTVKGL